MLNSGQACIAYRRNIFESPSLYLFLPERVNYPGRLRIPQNPRFLRIRREDIYFLFSAPLRETKILRHALCTLRCVAYPHSPFHSSTPSIHFIPSSTHLPFLSSPAVIPSFPLPSSLCSLPVPILSSTHLLIIWFSAFPSPID